MNTGRPARRVRVALPVPSRPDHGPITARSRPDHGQRITSESRVSATRGLDRPEKARPRCRPLACILYMRARRRRSGAIALACGYERESEREEGLTLSRSVSVSASAPPSHAFCPGSLQAADEVRASADRIRWRSILESTNNHKPYLIEHRASDSDRIRVACVEPVGQHHGAEPFRAVILRRDQDLRRGQEHGAGP